MNSEPRTTLLLGGLGLALVGLHELLPFALNWMSASYGLESVIRSAAAQSAQLVVLLASCIVLAFGFRHEKGIVGTSVLGRAALLLVGLALPVQALASWAVLRGAASDTGPALVFVTALYLLPIVAMSVAAVVVARRRVLEGFARWALIGVAAAELLVFVLISIPSADQDYTTALVLYITATPPLLLTIAGITYAAYGRSAAIRRRVRSVYRQWRMTT